MHQIGKNLARYIIQCGRQVNSNNNGRVIRNIGRIIVGYLMLDISGIAIVTLCEQNKHKTEMIAYRTL